MALPSPRLTAALALAAGLALAAPAGAELPLRLASDVAELTRGLICAPPPAGRREAPDTAFGWIHVPDEPIVIRREGTTVPAVLGIGLGVRFRLHGEAPRLLRYVVEHPPMEPQGRTRQSWDGWTRGEGEHVFFQFDLPEELLPGLWSFTAFDGRHEVFHATFKVVTPEEAPELAQLCEDEEEELLALSR